MTEEQEAPKKRKKVDGKKKGGGFEGQIVKILGEAFKPMMFRRSQSSGAILGGTNARFMQKFSSDAKALFIGDVVPTNEADVARDEGWKFRFTVECKFYKSVDTLEQLFNNTKIKGWFEQARGDADKLGKEPLLIFKFNRTGTFCAVDSNTIGSMPTTAKKALCLIFEDGLCLNIMLLNDSLLDLDWWKTRENIPSSQPIGL